jgi:hypothetical protein
MEKVFLLTSCAVSETAAAVNVKFVAKHRHVRQLCSDQ